jgi:hypothetical protein
MKDYSFKKWDPYTYLNDYFTDIPEFEDTIRFIIQTLRGKFYDEAIDIGCGPTVCYWSAVSNFCNHIDIADYKKPNLDAIHDWVNGKNTFDWSHYSGLALKYNNILATPKSIHTYETRAKAKLRDAYICDVFTSPVIKEQKQYDLVSTFYCADSITKNKEEWSMAMTNICSLVRPNGTVIGGAMEKCSFYSVGNMRYPSANLTVSDIRDYFVENNFSSIDIVTGKEFYRGSELRRNHNYSNLIFFVAST